MRVVHFSLLEAHQSHALLNPLMTGRLTKIGSSLKQRNFYLLQIRHQRARSICYSTSGLQLSRSTMIYLRLPTVAMWETFYGCSCISLFSEYKELASRCLPQRPIPSESHPSYFPIALYHSPMFPRFVRSSRAQSEFGSYFPAVAFHRNSSGSIRKPLGTTRSPCPSSE